MGQHTFRNGADRRHTRRALCRCIVPRQHWTVKQEHFGKQTYQSNGRHTAVLLTKAQISGVPLLTCAGMLSQSPFGPGRYQVALSAGDAVRRKKLPRYVLQQIWILHYVFARSKTMHFNEK